MSTYPVSRAERDRFVLERRAARSRHDPWRYHDVMVEQERGHDGRIANVATIFLTGRECPWRCVMCDLWRFTIETDTPRGAIAAQVTAARRTLAGSGVTQLKLYNAGSFFDPRAVPETDYEAIAGQLGGLDRVIVESHPALIGGRLDRWLDVLARQGGPGQPPPELEVAMGLETVHPRALDRLHKRMTVDTFVAAARQLGDRRVALRVFLLIAPPFVPQEQQDEWLLQSVECALSCGAGVVSLIPTRPGNGALDAIAAEGDFHPPRLSDIERSAAHALRVAAGRGRVFVDLWDLERFSECSHCYPDRHARLHAMNLEQQVPRPVPCHDDCGHPAD